jgi:hypothetical protein
VGSGDGEGGGALVIRFGQAGLALPERFALPEHLRSVLGQAGTASLARLRRPGESWPAFLARLEEKAEGAETAAASGRRPGPVETGVIEVQVGSGPIEGSVPSGPISALTSGSREPGPSRLNQGPLRQKKGGGQNGHE